MRTATAAIIASTLSAAITYAATRAEVREPVTGSVLDSICIHTETQPVDAGAGGLVQRRQIVGLNASVRGQIASLVPHEKTEPVRIQGIPLVGACRTDAVAWAQSCILPAVKQAAALP